MTDLLPIIADIRAGLKHVDDVCGRYDQTRDWFQRRDREIAVLTGRLEANHGAKVSTNVHAARVRIAGIAASCTAGVAGAYENWVNAAERRLQAEASS